MDLSIRIDEDSSRRPSQTYFPRTTALSGCPMFAPALPGFPTARHQRQVRVRLSLKESRMNLLNATNLDRKSGIRGPNKLGRPQISYFALLARAMCAALLKESRMKS